MSRPPEMRQMFLSMIHTSKICVVKQTENTSMTLRCTIRANTHTCQLLIDEIECRCKISSCALVARFE